ncbi:uncharacterized protein LOC135501299 isoform X2 [Lineus longissimus]
MVKVEVNFNTTLNFPAVAICNQNSFRVTEAVKHGQRDLLNAIYSHNPTPLAQILSDPSARQNAGKIFSDLAHRKEDMIVRCSYNQQKCSPDNFTMAHTDHGVCYFFNYGHNHALSSNKTGSEAGLQVTINVEQYEYMEGPHDSAGIKLLLYDRNNIPVVKELGHGVATGTHTFVGAEVLVMSRIGPPKGNCITSNTRLRSYPFYTDVACKMECLTTYVYSQCHCRAHHMPNIGGMRVCSLRAYLLCAIPAREEFSKIELETCKGCAPECQSTIYSPRFSYLTTASHDVDSVLKILNETKLLQRYIKARDTSYFVDHAHFKEDKKFIDDIAHRAEDVDNVLGKNLSTIITEQLEQIENTFDYAHDIHSNMSHIYNFQDFVVRMNFVRGALAKDERTLVSVGKGFVEYIRNFERNLRLLQSFTPEPQNASSRLLLYQTMKDKLLTKAWLAEWAQRNVDDIKNSYMKAKPIFKYRFDGKTSEEHALIAPRSILYESVTNDHAAGRLEDISRALVGAKIAYDNLTTILDDVYTNNVFNPSIFGMIRTEYMKIIIVVNGLRSAVIEDVVRKPIDVMNEKIERFNQLYNRIDVLLGEMKQDLKVLNETVSERDVIWTAMLDIVNKSVEYLQDINIGKTALCGQIMSLQLEQNIEKFESFFEVLRSRSRTLKDAWNTTYQGIIEFVTNFLVDNDTYNYITSNWTSSEFFMSIEDLYNEEGFNNYSQRLREEIGLKQHEGDLNALFGTKDRTFVVALRKYQDSCREYLSGNRIDKNFYRNNFLSMDVYFSELNYELIQQQAAYDIIALLSDIGGSLGLFLGASAISLFELVDLFLFNYAKKKKKENEIRRRQSLSHEPHVKPEPNDTYIKPIMKPAIKTYM